MKFIPVILMTLFAANNAAALNCFGSVCSFDFDTKAGEEAPFYCTTSTPIQTVYTASMSDMTVKGFKTAPKFGGKEEPSIKTFNSVYLTAVNTSESVPGHLIFGMSGKGPGQMKIDCYPGTGNRKAYSS